MSHCTLCLEFIHATHMHRLFLMNLSVLDLDSQCSRRSSVFAALCNFLHQPFDSLWIYFMDTKKAYSAVLLSVLNVSGEKKQLT